MKSTSRVSAWRSSFVGVVAILLWLLAMVPNLARANAAASQTRIALQSTNPGLPDGFPEFPGEELPVFLLTSTPQNQATDVPLNSPITFTFFTPMAPRQSISWSANVDSSKFVYSWSGDGTVLTAVYFSDLPASSLITWTLDPSGFQSASGAPLLAQNSSGAFTTGTGQGNSNDPCDGGSTNVTTGVINLFKSISYLQTNASAPVIDPGIGATFLALVSWPPGNPITEASVRLPGGTVKTIPNLFGTLFLSEQFTNQEALDAAYPAGSYEVTIQQASGSSSTRITVGSGVPPTPQISNFATTQSYNAASDYTLQWGPFTGVAPIDSLYLSISDVRGTNFSAPDLCVPRLLANTATSIVIPANTFSVGGAKNGSLSFSKVGDSKTNALPNISIYASYNKSTDFTFKSTGQPPAEPPQILNLTRLENGLVQFEVEATTGVVVTVEGSDDLELWVPVTSGAATGA